MHIDAKNTIYNSQLSERLLSYIKIIRKCTIKVGAPFFALFLKKEIKINNYLKLSKEIHLHIYNEKRINKIKKIIIHSISVS